MGPDYAHAEARKSPALDGKVERDSEGKEVRYPVILSNKEKLIARKVCLAFNQMVCGFDLLRWVILNRTCVKCVGTKRISHPQSQRQEHRLRRQRLQLRQE